MNYLTGEGIIAAMVILIVYVAGFLFGLAIGHASTYRKLEQENKSLKEKLGGDYVEEPYDRIGW